MGIRTRLGLLILGITALVVAITYATVVPQLDSQIRDDRIEDLLGSSTRYRDALQNDIAAGISIGQVKTSMQKTAQFSGYRLILLSLDGPQFPDAKLQLSHDTGDPNQTVELDFPIARAAVEHGAVSTGLRKIGGIEYAQVAQPVFGTSGTIERVVIFASSLADVNKTVGHLRDQLLRGAGIALLVALIVGVVMTRPLARRIRRLEVGARSVAAGNFTDPIVDRTHDEIGSLARAFNEMQNQLARLDLSRKAFIANASHELRTPLFSLGGFVELLQEEELDAETRKEFLETMRLQVNRLTKLATNLLDLSRLDSGSLDMRPERVGLIALTRSIAKEFTGVLSDHTAELELHLPDEEIDAFCDPDRAAQVLRIVIDNAISHTPPQTKVDISVTARNDGWAGIRVADNGPGIPESELERVFERFHTGDKSGGTGLGLSIANELVTAMGARFALRSKPGRTIAEITFPAIVHEYPTADRA